MMDSDEERARYEHINKLRGSGSISPSTISTASSGSPLVRGPSETKARPAPTSIAAAQLQRQQLEFTNRLQRSGDTKSTNNSINFDWQKDDNSSSKSKKEHQSDNKSFGYNMAKSMMFKVYGLNEFWSVSKMRYMNLACLLMTLLCLVTILFLSSSGNNSNTIAVTTTSASRTEQQLRGGKSHAEDESEIIDSLDSQPLVRSGSRASQAASENGFDDYSLLEDRDGDIAKPKRRSEPSGEPNKSSAEREVEENQAGESGDSNLVSGVQKISTSDPSDSLMDPFFSQIFDDMDIGPLFKSLRKTNRTSNGKAIVKKNKNGATIIISSSSFNDPNSNESLPIPSILEKLLSPMLRSTGSLTKPLFDSGKTTIAGPYGASATLNLVGSESPFGFTRMSPFGQLTRSQYPGRFHPFSPFMDPSSLRSPFGPMFGSSAVMMPAPSLLSMIMRPSSIEPENEAILQFPRSSIFPPRSTLSIMTSSPEVNKIEKNDTLAAQSSQNSTTVVQKSSDNKKNESESDAEVLPRLSNRFHSVYARPRPQAGSMVIFSSGILEPQSRDPFQLPGSLASSMAPSMGPSNMMFIGGSDHRSPSPLNPILRSVLSNVFSELGPLLEERNKTDRTQGKNREASNLTPSWTAPYPGEPDYEWSDVDKWDDANSSSRQLRARHRDDDTDSSNSESDFVTGLDHSSSSPLSMMSDRPLDSGLMSETIMQSIRGPGVNVERIIEVPSGRSSQQGFSSFRTIRPSQSREDFDESSEHPLGRQYLPPNPLFSRHINDRMSNDEFSAPHANFITKFLSDISRRSDRPRSLLKNRSAYDDLDEGDSNDSTGGNNIQPKTVWPKIRVTSARIRLRGMGEQRAADSSQSTFLPPNHIGIPDEQENEKESSSNLLSTFNDQKMESSFEDNLNSMEDRLNHVLSMASHNTRSILKSNVDKPSSPDIVNRSAPSVTATVEKITSPVGIMSSKQVMNEPQMPKQLDNLFTSPLSPLFGFPSSILQSSSDSMNRPSQTSAGIHNNNGQRQQRSFTYHSNNELANPFMTGVSKQDTQQPPETAESRAKVFAQLPAPAGLVMGRRLDDSPSFNEPNHRDTDMIGRSAMPSPGFTERRGIISSAASGEDYRTIVV